MGDKIKKLSISSSSRQEIEKRNIKSKIEEINKELEYLHQKFKQVYGQEGEGLKISNLPLFLAQLYAGNNSKKLKNDINQLLNSLCKTNQITKLVYENLTAVKILNNKIKANKVQYDLDRLNAEISAYSSGNLDK